MFLWAGGLSSAAVWGQGGRRHRRPPEPRARSVAPPGAPPAATRSTPIPPFAYPHPHPQRHQWYQLGDKVVVDVYAKALAPDRFSAQFSDTRLKLSVARAPASSSDDAAAGRDAAAAGNSDAAAAAGDKEGAAAGGDAEGGAAGEEGPEWELDVELYGPVEAAACRFEVLRTKVEVTLKKAPPLRAWPTLERSDKPALPVPAPAPAPAPKPAAAADAAAAAPGAAEAGPPLKYPSSYVKAPKDWSALEKEVKEMESKGELDEGDPLNSFFQKIFSQVGAREGPGGRRRAAIFTTSVATAGYRSMRCAHVIGLPPRSHKHARPSSSP